MWGASISATGSLWPSRSTLRVLPAKRADDFSFLFMLTQIKKEEWPAGDYRPTAAIRQIADNIYNQFHIYFDDIEEDGLGRAKVAFLRTPQDCCYILEEFLDGEESSRGTITIFCLYNAMTMTSDLEEILIELELEVDSVIWSADEICFQKHEVWRQDDNGNRFLISVTPNRADAVLLERRLSKIPHKQTYWTERREQ